MKMEKKKSMRSATRECGPAGVGGRCQCVSAMHAEAGKDRCAIGQGHDWQTSDPAAHLRGPGGIGEVAQKGARTLERMVGHHLLGVSRTRFPSWIRPLQPSEMRTERPSARLLLTPSGPWALDSHSYGPEHRERAATVGPETDLGRDSHGV